MYIDSHTHIYLSEFDEDRADVVARAQQASVCRMILPNVDTDTIPLLYDCVDQYPDICLPAMGLHPEAVNGRGFRERLLRVRRELDTASYQFVAIGEVGMDLYRDKTHASEQAEALSIQIEWAIEKDLPLILHSREAVPEVVTCLQKYASESNLRGVFHSFTGSADDLALILQLPTFMIGINGVVTFKKSHLSTLVPLIPTDRIIVETDAPYLSPAPKRGRRNEPAYLLYTVDFIARLFSLDTVQMAYLSASNTCRLFSLGSATVE